MSPTLSRFFFFFFSPLSWWKQIGEPKTWQDCNVSERFALGCRSAPLTSAQQWRQRRLQFSTTVRTDDVRDLSTFRLEIVTKTNPVQVGMEIKSQDGAASDFGFQVKYIAPSARARPPAALLWNASKYARDDENNMNAAAVGARHTVSDLTWLFNAI